MNQERIQSGNISYENSVRLTARGRKVVGATLATLALGTMLGGLHLKNTISERNKPVVSYSKNVESGSNLIETALKIKEDQGVDLNPTIVGQEASMEQSEQQGSSYIAKPGDTLIVYANKDNVAVDSEVKTKAEQNNNK